MFGESGQAQNDGVCFKSWMCKDPGAPWESQFQCADLWNRLDTGAFHKEFTFMIEYINVGLKKQAISGIK